MTDCCVENSRLTVIFYQHCENIFAPHSIFLLFFKLFISNLWSFIISLRISVCEFNSLYLASGFGLLVTIQGFILSLGLENSQPPSLFIFILLIHIYITFWYSMIALFPYLCLFTYCSFYLFTFFFSISLHFKKIILCYLQFNFIESVVKLIKFSFKWFYFPFSGIIISTFELFYFIFIVFFFYFYLFGFLSL